jgi:hypothetical protein
LSYQSQAQLEADYWFQLRVRSCVIQQAEHFKDDGRPALAALAAAVARDDPGPSPTFIRLCAAGPGIAEKAATDDGVDHARVTDDDLLSLVQALWPPVAALYDTAAP